MPEDSGGGEKTEEPTPKKRSDARKEGQVAMSAEVTTTGLLLAGFSLLMLMAPMMYKSMASGLKRALSESILLEMDVHTVERLFMQQFGDTGVLVFIFSLVLAVLAIGILLGQVGIFASFKPLVPKWSRISPISGFKRLFGLRGFMKFVFSLFKLILVVWIAYATLSVEIPQQVYFKMDLHERLSLNAWMIIIIGIKLAAVLAVVALGDFIYQRFQHNKDLMMTKQEVKEEMKQSDGDPLVKAKIRQIQRQMAQKRMMQEVPNADVVITNPTHVAVALKYDMENNGAPICLAKGYDSIAQRIKAIAAEHDIPQVENVPLARALAKTVEVGQEIPVEFYNQVAEVLSYVYKLKGKNMPKAG